MTQTMGARLSNSRRFLPLAATVVMFGLVYAFGVLSFPAMRDSQPLFNLVNTAPFLLIAVVGQSLVIISGGIDLSVGGVIALTTVATALTMLLGFSSIMGVVIWGGVLWRRATTKGAWAAVGVLIIIWVALGPLGTLSND